MRRAVHFSVIVKGKAGEPSASVPPRWWHKAPVALLRSAPTRTARLRESGMFAPADFCPHCPTHGRQKRQRGKLQNLPAPTSRSQLSAGRVSFGSSAPLFSPPPVLTHTGVFCHPHPPKKEYPSIITT